MVINNSIEIQKKFHTVNDFLISFDNFDGLDFEQGIIFDDSSKRHADLKIRLKYDSMTQSEFFRSLITGYLNKDKRILSYLDSYKQENQKKYSKRKAKIRQDDNKKADDLLHKFGIEDIELENIFDMIEQEFPDL